MRDVKDVVSSLGTLAMWWVVGYSIQTAARWVVRGPTLNAPSSEPSFSKAA